MEEILRNILMGLALAAPIGPASLAVIQAGLSGGFLRAFKTGLGITTADTTYMLLAFFGFARWVNIPWVRGVILSIGTLVLFYLGIQSILKRGNQIDFNATSEKTSGPPFLLGFMVNISNPLAAVFWLGIFGSLISTSEIEGASFSGLLRGASIMIGILSWHTTMSVLTHWGKRFINPKFASIISIAAGLALLLFAVRFAVDAYKSFFL
jgi:threonine/homoserine/homoserine lactone efflux protein